MLTCSFVEDKTGVLLIRRCLGIHDEVLVDHSNWVDEAFPYADSKPEYFYYEGGGGLCQPRTVISWLVREWLGNKVPEMRKHISWARRYGFIIDREPRRPPGPYVPAKDRYIEPAVVRAVVKATIVQLRGEKVIGRRQRAKRRKTLVRQILGTIQRS